MTRSESVEIVVIGAGIAGSSLAAGLPGRNIVVLEQEAQPGIHATGRSAAIFSATYGSPVVRALSRATLPFLQSPPRGFSEHGLLSSRGILFIARDDQMDALETYASKPDIAAATQRLSAEAVRAQLPILRPGYAREGVLEPDACEIDVNALQLGYLRQARAQGARLVTDARVVGIERVNGSWSVETTRGVFRAPVIVNAAGAWAGDIAAKAGARSIAFKPLRRTVVLVDPPADAAIGDWPMTVDMDEQFYLKPDAGRLLLSPADETASEACDSQPEELDVAIAIDRVETATTLAVRRVLSSWAGLRTFAPDRSLVIGFDPDCAGFFWLAGQGGYGIQTCQGAALAAAALIADKPLPQRLQDQSVSAAALSPTRFAATKAAEQRSEHPVVQ